MEETTRIDFMDLVRRFLLKWRLIIVFAVIGAVVFNVFNYRKENNAALAVKAEIAAIQAERQARLDTLTAEKEAQTEQTEQTTQQTAQRIETRENANGEVYEVVVYSPAEFAAEFLSDAEWKEVLRAADAYKLYQEQYNGYLNRISDSIYLHLDPNAVPCVELQYYVDTHFNTETGTNDPTGSIIYSYRNYIFGEKVLNEMVTASKLKANTAAIRDLISFSDDYATFTIRISGPDKDTCQAMSAEVDKAIRNASSYLRTVYGSFDLTKVNEQYSEYVDTSIFSALYTQNTNMNTLRNQMDAVNKNFSKKQNRAFNSIVSGMDIEIKVKNDTVEETDESETAEEIEDVAIPVVPKVHIFSPTAAILGVLIGILVVAVWTLLTMVLGGKLRTKHDPEDYKINVFGSMPAQPKKKLFSGADRAINRWFADDEERLTEEERLNRVAAGIRIAAGKAGVGSLYLTGTCLDDETAGFRKMLADKLNGGAITVNEGSSILLDPESLENIASADAAVIVEKVDVTRNKDLCQEMKTCGDLGLKVLGAVILKV